MQLAPIPGRTAILTDLRTATTRLEQAQQQLEGLTIQTGGTTAAGRVEAQTRILDRVVGDAARGVDALRSAAGRLLRSEAGEALGNGIAYRMLERARYAGVDQTADALLELAGHRITPDSASLYLGTKAAASTMLRLAESMVDSARSVLLGN